MDVPGQTRRKRRTSTFSVEKLSVQGWERVGCSALQPLSWSPDKRICWESVVRSAASQGCWGAGGAELACPRHTCVHAHVDGGHRHTPANEHTNACAHVHACSRARTCTHKYTHAGTQALRTTPPNPHAGAISEAPRLLGADLPLRCPPGDHRGGSSLGRARGSARPERQ